MSRNFLNIARILFWIDGCSKCNIYKQFIYSINENLPLNKQIQDVDCTMFHDFGIDSPIIRFFYQKGFLDGNYPVLIFEGEKISGANTRVEAEMRVRTLVHDDFIVEQNNPYLFNKECSYKKGMVVCKDI